MSLILDALRRKSAAPAEKGESQETARTNAVLATLGYPRRQSDTGFSLGKSLLYGGAALAAGCLRLPPPTNLLTPAPQKPNVPGAGPLNPASPGPATDRGVAGAPARCCR